MHILGGFWGKKIGRKSGIFPENPGCSSWNGMKLLGEFSACAEPILQCPSLPHFRDIMSSVTSHFPVIPSSVLDFGMLELILVVPLASSMS